jgi:hypothetical protein
LCVLCVECVRNVLCREKEIIPALIARGRLKKVKRAHDNFTFYVLRANNKVYI